MSLQQPRLQPESGPAAEAPLPLAAAEMESLTTFSTSIHEYLRENINMADSKVSFLFAAVGWPATAGASPGSGRESRGTGRSIEFVSTLLRPERSGGAGKSPRRLATREV